jgi:hypothetical protein
VIIGIARMRTQLTSHRHPHITHCSGTESGSLADGTVTVSRLTALTKEMASLRETAQAARLYVCCVRELGFVGAILCRCLCVLYAYSRAATCSNMTLPILALDFPLKVWVSFFVAASASTFLFVRTILKLRSMLPLQPSADNKPPQDEAQDKANDQLQAQTLDKVMHGSRAFLFRCSGHGDQCAESWHAAQSVWDFVKMGLFLV